MTPQQEQALNQALDQFLVDFVRGVIEQVRAKERAEAAKTHRQCPSQNPSELFTVTREMPRTEAVTRAELGSAG